MKLEEYKALVSEKKPKRRYKKIEDGICHQIVQYLNLNEKAFIPHFWTHIANEASDKSIKYGMRLKRLGKKAGLGDYLFLWKGNWGWLEVKQSKAKQLPSQKEFENVCLSVGGFYNVVHSLEEAIETIKNWGLFKKK